MDKKKSNISGHSPVLSSLIVGSAEATLLHPLGTWIKLYHMRQKAADVFPGAYTPYEKFKITCRGIHLAAPNKIISRVVTLGAQPLIKKRIDGHFNEITAQVVAGIGPGIAATLLTMPLDTYKSKCQTGCPTLNIMTLFRDSQKAFLPTVTRNLIGMSSLFGGAALVRQRMPGPRQGQAVSSTEDLAACLIGGIMGAVFSNPADVIKTRTQMSGQSVMHVIRDLGFFGMGRGLGLNLVKGVQRGAVYWLTRQAAGPDDQAPSKPETERGSGLKIKS